MKTAFSILLVAGVIVCTVLAAQSVQAEPYCDVIPDPCEASCSLDKGNPFNLSRWNVSGFMEGTIRVNSHGAKSNGDVFSGGNGSTNFNLNQLWLFVDREMDTSKGFDWGFNAGMCFGMDGSNIAKWHDQSFDYKWGSGDYGLAFNNLKFKAGYKKLSVDAGIFGTEAGWEATETFDNFFMSGANVNSMMPTSHLGVIARYEVNDRLTVSGGFTNGFDNGGTSFNDNAFVGGFEFKLTKKIDLTYAVLTGSTHDGILPDGEERYGDGRTSGYLHTLDLCWNISDRFYWMTEWMLANNACLNNGIKSYLSGYGVNQYLVYTLNDRWSFGARFDWLHDGVDTDSDYNEVSLGANYLPYTNIKIRPELRYDWVIGEARPFAENTKSTQFSAGVSLFYQF